MRRFLWIGVGVAVAAAAAAAVWPRERFEVTTRSKSAYLLYREAVAALERIEIMAAREKLLQAVEADSTFAMAYARLGFCYSRLSWNDEKQAALAKAKRYAEHATELEQLQIEYLTQTLNLREEEAQATLDVMIAKYPDDPEVLYQHAMRIWTKAERTDDMALYDQAYEMLHKCLVIDPTRVNCHNLLGYIEWARGNFDAAIANLQRYAYYCPGQANPQDSLAEIYFMAGRYEEAIAHYLEALRLNPAFDNSALQAAKVLSVTGQYSQAHQVLDTVKQVFVEMKQERRLEMAHLGVDFEAGRWETVLASTDRLLPFPAQPDVNALSIPSSVYAMRAFAQMELGRFDQAAASLDAREAYWDAVQRLDPMPLSKTNLGEIDLNEQMMRARLWALQGRFQQASDLVARAFQTTSVPPRNLRLFFYPPVAETRLRVGDAQGAAEMARATLELVPTHPVANRVLGLALAQLGDNDGAQSALAVYLHVMRAADPGNPKVEEARALFDRLRAAS